MEQADRTAVVHRLDRNLLSVRSRTTDAAAVVARLCGVQAQELPAARLAIRARSTGLTDAGVEAARVEERSLVRTWAMRGTLHLVASQDMGWLRRLLAPRLIKGSARRSAQLGLDEATYDKASAVLRKELAGGGALDRAGLRPILEAARIDTSGQRLVYLLYRAALDGLVCEGPQVAGKPAYVLVEEWLPGAGDGDQGGIDRLLRRYLGAYGPAGPEDLAAWSGLPLAGCREAFAQASEELQEMPVQARRAWVLRDEQLPGQPDGATVRLLPGFDTFLLGYRDRGLHLGAGHARKVNAGGGIVKPVLLVDGFVEGVWQLVRRGRKAEVVVQPFGRLTAAVEELLHEETEDVARFLGVPASLELGKPSGRT